MSKRKIIAIIPARGGSKGVYKKNIKIVKEKPLIAYTIEVAKKSEFIDETFVSTEDEEIAEISKNYSVKIIPRPIEYARDDTPDLPVFKHAVKYLEENEIFPDWIVNLRPTAPLREPKDIDNVIRVALNSGVDSVRSFCEVEEHPYWMFRIQDGQALPFLKKYSIKQYPRRQLLPKLYIINGSVDVMSVKCIKNDSLYGNNIGAYIMSRKKSIDLDTEEDFKRLEEYI